MSSFLETFTTEPDKTHLANSFVQRDTRAPIKVTNDIALSEQHALYALEDANMETMKAYTINFFVGGDSLTNKKIDDLVSQRLELQTQSRAFEIAGLEKAVTFKQKTCPCCNKKVYMDRFNRIIDSLKKMHVAHGLSYQICDHSRRNDENPFPYTQGEHKKLLSFAKKIEKLSEKIEHERMSYAKKLHKQKKIEVKALVAAYLHESLYHNYCEDY